MKEPSTTFSSEKENSVEMDRAGFLAGMALILFCLYHQKPDPMPIHGPSLAEHQLSS